MSKKEDMKAAALRLHTVFLLLKRVGINVWIEDLRKMDARGLYRHMEGISICRYKHGKRRATPYQIDDLTVTLLHELAHAIQERVGFYKEMWAVFGTQREMDRHYRSIKDEALKLMHIEHSADAFAVDMAIKLGMPNAMDHMGYI